MDNNSQVTEYNNNQLPVSATAQPMVQPKAQDTEYISFKPETVEEKKMVFNSTKKCDDLLRNHIDEVVGIKNFYFKIYFNTKEQKNKCRVVIFTDENKTYITTSFQIMQDLRSICSVFGEPSTWSEPVKVKINEVTANNGKALTLILND